MTDQTVLIVAGIAALVIVVMFFKLLGNVFKAVFIAAIAAAALYFLLPRLEQQDGAIGEAAKKAREATSDLEGSVQKLKDKASDISVKASEGAKNVKEAAESVKKAQKAVDDTRKAVEAGGK